jgi:cytochrome c oxidase subunit 4
MTARALILTYVALVALAAASFLAANTGVALAIAVAKAILIALVFMELWRAHASDRMIALAAVFFVLLMCAGALADVTLR